MRRTQRLVAAVVLAAMSVTLVGCGGGAFDPTDMMDWFDTKKKIPGERKPVFPEGVPGVEQGVPRELYKGAQQQEPPPVAEMPPAPEPRAKRSGAKSTARSAPRSVAPAEPAQDAPDADEGTAAAPPAPPPARPKRKRITAPPPDAAPPPQQQQAAPPTQSQPTPPPFPAPLPSGSFAR